MKSKFECLFFPNLLVCVLLCFSGIQCEGSTFKFLGTVLATGSLTAKYFPEKWSIYNSNLDDSTPFLEVDFENYLHHSAAERLTLAIKSSSLWFKDTKESINFKSFDFEAGLYVKVIPKVNIGIATKYLGDTTPLKENSSIVTKSYSNAIALRYSW